MQSLKIIRDLIKIGVNTTLDIYFTPLIPISATIIVTNKCNSRCIYCEAYLYNSSSELTTKQIISIIDEIDKKGVHNLILGGGEPFLRQDIFDILEHCRRQNLIINILTNGLTIHKFGTNEINTIIKCVKHIFYLLIQLLPQRMIL